MTVLDGYLEQISLSAAALTELSFPAPKIFTNALLHQHDITALIRDTEVHERALFSVPSVTPQTTAQNPTASNSRRKTVYSTNPGSNEDALLASSTLNGKGQRNAAVAAVLGGELVERMRRSDMGGHDRGDIDVDMLLTGAEKLCRVYPVSGALEKISAQRRRYKQLAASITHYEDRVEGQTAQLYQMNQSRDDGTQDNDFEDSAQESEEEGEELLEEITQADLDLVEDEIKQLERKKRMLEERVSGMEKDLGGLLR